jgi:hypothetical protein
MHLQLWLISLLFWGLITPALGIFVKLATRSDHYVVLGTAMAAQSGDQEASKAEATPPVSQFEELPPPVKPVPPPAPIFPDPPVISPASATTDSAPPMLEVDGLPSVIARPNLPQELQLREIPLPRPRSVQKESLPSEDSPSLTLPSADLPMMVLPSEGSPVLILPSESWARTPKSMPLLPEPDPEPGIVYVIPFIYMMVPLEVQERIFDQVVDMLNKSSDQLQLKFVIFKSQPNENNRSWLKARKHITGEIYSYIEDSGCCSTDLRARVRLSYYRAHQKDPLLNYESSFRTFFDHDVSTLAAERQKLAEQIVNALVAELMKSLQS